MKSKTNYIIAVEAADGNCIFSFSDPADITNFIMDIQDNVGNMAIAIDEGE